MKEIERKFLVYLEDIEFDISSFKSIYIEQFYISLKPEVRVRSSNGVYYLTKKGEGDLSRDEEETEISQGKFENLKSQMISKIIKKTRHIIPLDKKLIAEFDVYDDCLAGLFTAEVEFASKNQALAFQKPSWFYDEVTYDSRYKNKNLATYGNPQNGMFISGINGKPHQLKISTFDIYKSVDLEIVEKGYWELSTDKKKVLDEAELLKYTIEKTKEMGIQNILDNGVCSLDEILMFIDSKIIFDADKEEFFRYYSHYILSLMGSMQGWSIDWNIEDGSELIKRPFASFDVDNKLVQIITHMQTPPVITTRFLLEIFGDYFFSR